MQLRAVSNNGGLNGSYWEIEKPAGLQVGDFMIMYGVCPCGDTTTIGYVSGGGGNWGDGVIVKELSTDFATYRKAAALFWKFADAADVATSRIIFSFDILTDVICNISAWTGVDPANPMNGITPVMEKHDATPYNSGLTTGVENCVLCTFGAISWKNSVGNINEYAFTGTSIANDNPSSWTQFQAYGTGNTTAGFKKSASYYSTPWRYSGATGNASFTVSNAYNRWSIAAIVCLKPFEPNDSSSSNSSSSHSSSSVSSLSSVSSASSSSLSSMSSQSSLSSDSSQSSSSNSSLSSLSSVSSSSVSSVSSQSSSSISSISSLSSISTASSVSSSSASSQSITYNSKDDFNYTDMGSYIRINDYHGSSKTCNIPPTIDSKPVTTIVAQAFRSSGFEYLTVPSSVTTIGDSTNYQNGVKTAKFNTTSWTGADGTYDNFKQCASLTSCTLPTTGFTKIPSGMFYNCTSLTALNVPNCVTTIGNSCISECYAVTTVTIGTGLTTIEDYWLYGTSGLTGTITFPASLATIGTNTWTGCNSSGVTGWYFEGNKPSGTGGNLPCGTVYIKSGATGWPTPPTAVYGRATSYY